MVCCSQETKLSVLINSCDSYEDLWYPYFELFRMNWSDCSFPVYLNTESKKYVHPQKLPQEIITINYKKNKLWCERLYHALSLINTKYVLVTLDDSFLRDRVKTEEIQRIVGYLEEDNNIASFSLYPSDQNYIPSRDYPSFMKVDKTQPFLVSCVTTIWDKKKLMKLIRKSESPWEFEENASLRASKSSWDFYAYQASALKDYGAIYPYYLGLSHGEGVWHGKWLFNTKKLFESFSIEADFSQRGSWKSWDEVNRYIDVINREPSKARSPFRSFLHECLPDKLILIIKRLKRSH